MFFKKKKSPTDREILQVIYDQHYQDFISWDDGIRNRCHKYYIPIDCLKIGMKLGVNRDIIFGRLDGYLSHKYCFEEIQSNGSKNVTKIFQYQINSDHKCVHFPLLAAVLAELQEDHRRTNRTFWFSVIAIVISLLSLAWNVFENPISDEKQIKPVEIQIVDEG